MCSSASSFECVNMGSETVDVVVVGGVDDDDDDDGDEPERKMKYASCRHACTGTQAHQ